MRRMLSLLLLMAIVFGLVACGEKSIAQVPLPPDLQFVVLNSNVAPQFGTAAQKQFKVISTQDEYTAELANYPNPTQIPASVDFSKGKVLLVNMGERPTSGYSIKVTSVNDSPTSSIPAENHVTANVTLTVPGSCFVTFTVTNPYQFVFIPTQKEILISEKLVVDNTCMAAE